MPITRLHLGAGKHTEKIRDDQYHDTLLDLRPFPGIDIIGDLNLLPWHIAENSFDEVIGLHVVEHLNSLINFMNECHRVLKPGGSLYLETPEAGADADLEFADPTHVRCYRKHSFINYFTKSGIAHFGYTDKAWSILHIEVRNSVIIFHGMPIK
jgi:SAM-dependent methyltransferase